MNKKKLKSLQYQHKKTLKYIADRKKKIKDLKNMPVTLIDHGEAFFTDRLGNVLNRGDMVCYPSGSELKIGVFVGLIEKTFERYERDSYGWKVGNSIIERKRKLAFAVLDKKENMRMYYTDFDPEENPEGISFNKYVIVNRPEFSVGVPEVAKCFALIDNLKDGILKDCLDDNSEV